MKNSNNSKVKKQLISGAVYIALAVTVVAVTVSTLSATLSGLDSANKNFTVNDTHYGSDLNIKLPEINYGDFTLDTPVSDVKQGVDANITENQTPGNFNGIDISNIPEQSVKNPQDSDAENKQSGTVKPDEMAENEQNKLNEQPQKNENNAAADKGTAVITPENEIADKKKVKSEEPAEPTFDLGYDGFIKPCAGYISKEFSISIPVYSATMYDYRAHSGVDIACEVGSPVRAVTNGEIVDVYNDYMFGTTVVIEHADGVKSIYSNLSSELPTETVSGKMVLTGETFAGVGNTALCESAEVSHLHFGMTKNGASVNPEDYITW